jgi:hypothetical protein
VLENPAGLLLFRDELVAWLRRSRIAADEADSPLQRAGHSGKIISEGFALSHVGVKKVLEAAQERHKQHAA